MKEYGLYKIKDQYFSDFQNPYWIDNKQEKRPYYFLLKDRDGIYWMIPISSQTENYKKKIAREESKRGAGNSIFYHIGLIGGQERAFVISDMFPVDQSYVKGEYTISGTHYVVRTESLIFAIHTKAMRYLKLVETRKLHSRNNIMGIKQQLVNRTKNAPDVI